MPVQIPRGTPMAWCSECKASRVLVERFKRCLVCLSPLEAGAAPPAEPQGGLFAGPEATP